MPSQHQFNRQIVKFSMLATATQPRHGSIRIRNGLLRWLAAPFIGPLATLLIVVLPKMPTVP